MSLKVQSMLFLVVGTILIASLHRYLWARLIRDTELPDGWRKRSTIVLVLLTVSMPLAVGLARWLPPGVAQWFLPPVFVWMGLAFLLFVLLLLGEIVQICIRALDRINHKDPSDFERRKTISRLLGGGAMLLGTAEAGVGVVTAFSPVIERIKIPLAKLPKGLHGLRIVQLSDIHVGATIQRHFVEGVVAETNALSPDVIVITGDLVDGSVEMLREYVAPLGHLRARYGVFFVTGNHEYYSGAQSWVEHLSTLGIRTLRNERVEIGDHERGWIDLLGVEDYNTQGLKTGLVHDVAGAVRGRDGSRAGILLAHQPRSIFEAAKHGVDLQLSGHTHGGQIFPWNFLVRLQQPFVAGLDRYQKTWIYTHRGTGFWGPPMRVGATGEIAEITLESRSSA